MIMDTSSNMKLLDPGSTPEFAVEGLNSGDAVPMFDDTGLQMHLLPQFNLHYSDNSNPSRRRLSLYETKVLQSFFDRNTKPSSDERDALSKQLNLPVRTVQIWFQNRRAKLKREFSKKNEHLKHHKNKLDHVSQRRPSPNVPAHRANLAPVKQVPIIYPSKAISPFTQALGFPSLRYNSQLSNLDIVDMGIAPKMNMSQSSFNLPAPAGDHTTIEAKSAIKQEKKNVSAPSRESEINIDDFINENMWLSCIEELDVEDCSAEPMGIDPSRITDNTVKDSKNQDSISIEDISTIKPTATNGRGGGIAF